MRISDWSSDVCSSDLRLAQEAEARQNAALSAQITNMNKPPAGYSRNADGTLSPIPGGPADPSIASGRLTANQRGRWRTAVAPPERRVRSPIGRPRDRKSVV